MKQRIAMDSLTLLGVYPRLMVVIWHIGKQSAMPEDLHLQVWAEGPPNLTQAAVYGFSEHSTYPSNI